MAAQESLGIHVVACRSVTIDLERAGSYRAELWAQVERQVNFQKRDIVRRVLPLSSKRQAVQSRRQADLPTAWARRFDATSLHPTL